MHEQESTRRTALKVLGLGVGGAVGTGVASADPSEHETAAEEPDAYLARLEPQEDVETDARGVAVFQHRADQLKFVVAVVDVEDVFMAHIHEGEPLGPIAVWLHDFESRDERLLEGSTTGILDVGTITDEAVAEGRVEEADSETVADLVGTIEAGDAYVNVHTEAYPSGELAGRIEPLENAEALLGQLVQLL